MSKKLNWLDKFAAEQARKEVLKKEASNKKVANQIIVNPEEVPNAQNGSEIEFNGEMYRVVDANFSDEIGPGVVLEKSAAYEGLERDPMGMSMGQPVTNMVPESSKGQQYHYTKNDIQQTYTNDEDAQYGMSSAPITEQQIADENAVDRTTVRGRFTKSPDITAPETTQVAGPTPAEPVSEPTIKPPVQEEPQNVETEEEKENRILSKVKKNLPKKANTKKQVKKTAVNSQIINLASDVTRAIVAETEEILEDAEETVKKLVPAHLAAKALELLEEELEEEGIEALFEKTKSLNKTAGEDCDEEEVKEIVKKVAEAVVDEMEEMLADADETMDEERKTLANQEEEFEVEAKLKAVVERKLHAKGIYTRFARTAKKNEKLTVAQKIHKARRAQRARKK